MRVWDVESGQRLTDVLACQRFIDGNALLFTKNGDAVLTAGFDNLVNIWRVPVVPGPVPEIVIVSVF